VQGLAQCETAAPRTPPPRIRENRSDAPASRAIGSPVLVSSKLTKLPAMMRLSKKSWILPLTQRRSAVAGTTVGWICDGSFTARATLMTPLYLHRRVVASRSASEDRRGPG